MKSDRADIARFLIGFTAICGVASVVANRAHIGMKGTVVPLTNVGFCIVVGCVVAIVVQRAWHWVPAIPLAGIVGTIVGGIRPAGGVIGTLVGTAVVALSRLSYVTKRRS